MTDDNAERVENTEPAAPAGVSQESSEPQASPPIIVAPPPTPPQWLPQPPRRSLGRRLFRGFITMFFVLSIVLNFYMAAIIVSQMKKPMVTAVMREGDERQVVAVYSVIGVIDGQAATKFDVFCDRIMKDDSVKAVVLRVSSGGGGVSASDQIHRMVEALKEEGKKVVVSMGGVAASGGYYISAAADEIIAEPTTITGSIGVIMQWVVLRGTLEKLGMEPVVMKSRHAEEWKDELSPVRKPTPKQHEHLQAVLDKIQARFEQVVSRGRAGKLKPYQPEPGAKAATRPAPEFAAFNGKIYLADEAMELGLVDATGYLDDAIDRAASLAGLDNPRVLRYKRRKSVMEKLLSSESQSRLRLDANLLDELQTPRILLVWKAD